MPSFDSVVTSLGNVRPHVKPVAREVANMFGPLYFIWGAPGRGTGDHAKGLALDFMTYELGNGVDNPGPLRDSLGNLIASYVLANRQRLNVKYIIWNRRQVSATSKWKWRDYDGDNPHVDHVHVSFYATGTYRPPTNIPVPPPKEDGEIVAGEAEQILAALEEVQHYAVEAYGDTTAKLNTFEERAIKRFNALNAAIEALASAQPPSIRTAVRNALKDTK